MSKLYNTQGDIANNLNSFFTKICKSLTKVHLKILPYIIIGMIDAESVVTNDIIKKIKGSWALVKNESNQRRLRRFFNSSTFNIYYFYDCFIKHIITNFHPRKNDSIHISFDHCFCKNKFTILCFSLRLGKHGIPLWFRCFKGHDNPKAFITETIIEGIDYVSELLKTLNRNIVFLADRGFNYFSVMKHIDSLNHTFIIRAKGEIRIMIHDKEEEHLVRKFIKNIHPYARKSTLFYNVPISENLNYTVNIAVSKSNDVKEAWYLLTNGNPKRAVKFYSYRWSIECFFKNEKSNGFYLESTNVRNISAFSAMFGLSCIANTWLNIIGISYARNKGRKKYFITDVKRYKNVPKRIISFFEIGLIYFNIAYNSIKYFYLYYNFQLYDN